jgi:hypothetical protein
VKIIDHIGMAMCPAAAGKMGMPGSELRVFVRYHFRISSRPKREGKRGAQRGKTAQRRQSHRHAGHRAEPSRERVCNQPASMRERELSRKKRGTIFRLRRAAQQSPGRHLRRRICRAEQRPHHEKSRPKLAVRKSADHARADEQQHRHRHSGGKHHGTVANPVEHARQHERGEHRAAAESRKRDSDIRIREAKNTAHQHDGVDNDHRATGGYRQIQRQQTAKSRCAKIDANTLADASLCALCACGRGHARQ